MTIAMMSPSDFTHWVAVEGLSTSGGKVRLNRYVVFGESHIVLIDKVQDIGLDEQTVR